MPAVRKMLGSATSPYIVSLMRAWDCMKAPKPTIGSPLRNARGWKQRFAP